MAYPMTISNSDTLFTTHPSDLKLFPLSLSYDQKIHCLQQASHFAFGLYTQKTKACQAFIKSYPLEQTLSEQQIKDLIRDYTLDDNCQVADESTVMAGLRHLRNLLMLRWIWQDALSLISLEQLTWELSKFADFFLIFAKEFV